MVSLRPPLRRFSLILLEEGEDYVADWIVECRWPSNVDGNWQSLKSVPGTLRLCSKSMFFEPDDTRVPIIRLPFKSTQNLEPDGKRAFTVLTSVVIKMKQNMVDAPYTFEKARATTWNFTLAYAQVGEFLPVVHQYLAASRLPYAEQEDALQGLARKRVESAVFDTSRLSSFSETIQFNAPAVQHTPLVKELGRLVITQERLYFQPLDNVGGGMPVRCHPLAGIAAVARRRSSLRALGLELFFIGSNDGQLSGPTWNESSAFFAFESEMERERVRSILMDQPALGSAVPGGKIAAAACASLLEGRGEWLQKVTSAWQHGLITNLDYLLFCNLAAGRSFNDLSQWPVFPWVLADYDSARLDLEDPQSFRDLSLPMGALNPSRLKLFQQRFNEMPRDQDTDRPFLYGTHYSCPGYVMFWLVRAAPGHLLRLQNGKFDAPDRMFINLGDSYSSATSNPADVKELIPEFFLTDSRFLLNKEQLPLGIRQNGVPVGDVELPSWAQDSVDFLVKHRAALESGAVSANLHHWIDLIFGYKQQGHAAEEANNIFHHLTYEGAVDISSITDARHQRALEVQINEFGQCPRQIFKAPHPRRLVCPTAEEALLLGRAALSDQSRKGKPGAESEGGGLELSLALLKTIMAVTAGDKSNVGPSDPQVQQRLQSFDRLAVDASSCPPSVLSEQADLTESRQQDVQGVHSRGGNGPIGQPRPSADRLRDWGQNMGGHISTFANIARDRSLNMQERFQQSVSQSRLRGLFQRQGPALAPKQRAETHTAGNAGASVERQAANDRLLSPTSETTERSEEASLAEELAGVFESTHVSPPPKPGQPELASSPQSSQQTPGFWRPGVRERLSGTPKRIHAFSAPVTAVACWQHAAGPMAYCVSQSGSLKIFNINSSSQIRAARLGSQPLSSLALIPCSPHTNHPVVVSGSFDNKVYAYSVEFGRMLGSFEAHDDTVSCLAQLDTKLYSCSHDGSVKVWSLAEGREPWTSGSAAPESEIEFESTVTCLSAASDGVVASGFEEGGLALADVRSQQLIWQVEVAKGGITSVVATPDRSTVVAAAADGSLSLIELRKPGACLAKILCLAASPLQCCRTDGDTALASSLSGQIFAWDIAQRQGRMQLGSFKAPSPDGLYPPLAVGSSSVNSFDIMTDNGRLSLVAGHEDGALSLLIE